MAKSDQVLGKIVNSSSNFEISIGDTVQLISELMSSSIEITSTEERIRPKNSEVNRLFGDNSLLLKLTDWNPFFWWA